MKMTAQALTADFNFNERLLNEQLRVEKSFDVVTKKMQLNGRAALLYFVDGFVKDTVLEKLMEYLLSGDENAVMSAKTAAEFSQKLVSYMEASEESSCENIVTSVLSGMTALVIEGYSEAILIDVRTYPARGVEEPSSDTVLRGSRDGFIETLVSNTALIRRRVRDRRLTMEMFQIGEKSKTDVVLCYIDGIADKKVIKSLQKQLKSITIGSLSMSQESLAECLLQKQWYNPLPRARYTERPDSAAANVLEGKILILVDNSPAVMILPVSIFDFTQDSNDFYFPPLVGTYLRLVRTAVFILTLFLTPVWYLLIENPQYLPDFLSFLQVKEPNSVPIFVQLLIIEFVIDGLKLASLNTPSVLASSFSVVGALILGDFAVQARWFVPEVVLYMAFVAIANFTQPSFELGYALKLFRVMLLCLTAAFGLYGLIGGVLIIILMTALTKTITGRGYLFPLVPFNSRALLRLFVRVPINRNDS